MTPKDRLVTVKEGASNEEICGLLHKNRIEKLQSVFLCQHQEIFLGRELN